jgi:hypothetical protein
VHGLEALQARIDALLALRRRRWRLVQLPLLCAAAVGVAAAVALACATSRLLGSLGETLALIPLLCAGFLMLLAILPNETKIIRAFVLLAIAAGAYAFAVAAHRIGRFAAAGALARPGTVEHARVVTALAGLLVHGLAILSLLYAAVRERASSPAVLESAWRSYSAFACGLALAAAGAAALAAQAADQARLGVEAAVMVTALALALLGLLPGLKLRVHCYLMGRGAGRQPAAAGIAEILDGVRASEVLENAAATFTAVRLDKLTFAHLAQRRSSASHPDDGASRELSLRTPPGSTGRAGLFAQPSEWLRRSRRSSAVWPLGGCAVSPGVERPDAAAGSPGRVALPPCSADCLPHSPLPAAAAAAAAAARPRPLVGGRYRQSGTRRASFELEARALTELEHDVAGGALSSAVSSAVARGLSRTSSEVYNYLRGETSTTGVRARRGSVQFRASAAAADAARPPICEPARLGLATIGLVCAQNDSSWSPLAFRSPGPASVEISSRAGGIRR